MSPTKTEDVAHTYPTATGFYATGVVLGLIFALMFVSESAARGPERTREAVLCFLVPPFWPLGAIAGAAWCLFWLARKIGAWLAWEFANVRRFVRVQLSTVPGAHEWQPDLGPHRTPPKKCERCGR